MPDSLESFFTLISARVHKQGTLLALIDAPAAKRVELRPKRAGGALTWRAQDEATEFVRAAARDGNYLALISDAWRVGDEEWRPLSEQEIRFFRPELGPKGCEPQLTQASRLHASMLLTRLQMRHMLPRDLAPFGPHRGYQQLYLPAPFI